MFQTVSNWVVKVGSSVAEIRCDAEGDVRPKNVTNELHLIDKKLPHQIICHFFTPTPEHSAAASNQNALQVQNEKRKLETELEDVQKAKSELIQEAQSLESELFTLRWVVFVKI